VYHKNKNKNPLKNQNPRLIDQVHFVKVKHFPNNNPILNKEPTYKGFFISPNNVFSIIDISNIIPTLATSKKQLSRYQVVQSFMFARDT